MKKQKKKDKVQVESIHFNEKSGKIVCTTAGGKIIEFDEIENLPQNPKEIRNHLEDEGFPQDESIETKLK